MHESSSEVYPGNRRRGGLKAIPCAYQMPRCLTNPTGGSDHGHKENSLTKRRFITQSCYLPSLRLFLWIFYVKQIGVQMIEDKRNADDIAATKAAAFSGPTPYQLFSRLPAVQFQ
jgi:hypothetical protein